MAKVDELMALCDRLEASLAVGNDTRRHLLDTLLHEAPVAERGGNRAGYLPRSLKNYRTNRPDGRKC